MSGEWCLTHGEAGYPACLDDLTSPPAHIHGIGAAEVLDAAPQRAITIVGSRRAGGYGRVVACELGGAAADAGLLVVSGMALGCDSAAHEGALDAGGITLAVLGGGADVVAPPSKGYLYRRILQQGGAVVSEYPPGTPPTPQSFPERNRIMAALACLTVVVEGSHRSGTQITARQALDLGRSVGAVPGPVTSGLAELPNELIKLGAAVIRNPQDLLDEVLGVGIRSVERIGPALEPPLQEALWAVEAGAVSADAVATAAGLDGPAAALAVARLELAGYLQGDSAGRLGRTTLRAPG